ncbi:hypothetical protein [Deinococcus sp. QL22]|uniref:hypothetical protein n=1 Tax=Deinococcus sp. QL22 TaxID=2939437 RepID=UPI0020173A29|nr:hypothetical protein [Deinococcus sp. QL22]UQN10607.1 hypothetical protein M1R55_30905 [Deinococcus sp. QL22]
MTYRVILTENTGETRIISSSAESNDARVFYSAAKLHSGEQLALVDLTGETIAARSHGDPILLPAEDHI